MTDAPSGRRPLRIVHTENSLGWGGQEIRILTEAAGMIRRGHDLHLLCPPEATIHGAARARGIPVTPLPMGRKNLTGLRAVYRWLRDHPPDLLVTHSSTDSWLTAIACLGLPQAPPVVRLRHISAPIPRNWPTRWLYTRGCRRVVTTGEMVRRQMMARNGFAGERIVSIPSGIDLTRFSPGDRSEARWRLGLPMDAPILGIVATLRSWKGHRHLLEAMARLLPDPPLLVMVGDGPQRQILQAAVEDLGLSDRVRMPGNQEDVVPWLRAMDLFALPSYANEGVPQSLMQAMACGLPVISCPVGAIPEIIAHGDTGLLVPPRDPASLAAAVRRLVDDPGERRRLGERARRHALDHFSEETMLTRMEALFYELV